MQAKKMLPLLKAKVKGYYFISLRQDSKKNKHLIQLRAGPITIS